MIPSSKTTRSLFSSTYAFDRGAFLGIDVLRKRSDNSVRHIRFRNTRSNQKLLFKKRTRNHIRIGRKGLERTPFLFAKQAFRNSATLLLWQCPFSLCRSFVRSGASQRTAFYIPCLSWAIRGLSYLTVFGFLLPLVSFSVSVNFVPFEPIRTGSD